MGNLISVHTFLAVFCETLSWKQYRRQLVSPSAFPFVFL